MLPILYQSHEIIIYAYPLMMGLGWGIAYQLFMQGLPQTFSRSFSQFVFWGLFLSSWLGAKAFFLLTRPEDLKIAEDLSFWTGGGFVFYGGLILGTIFLSSLRLLKPKESATVFESLLPALPVGHAIGRIGCFLAGCCYGKVTSAFWAIHQHGADRHPTQLIEALGLGILGHLLFKRRALHKSLLAFYLMGYGSLRLMIEILRGDEVRGDWGGYSPSFLVSIALLGLGFILHFREKLRA
jgi:phosphatidylglycerol:prolipoprotein diacylglycerol transferase